MKKWRNLRNAENGRYKLSVIVLSVLLAASLLWQGVFAMLGTTGVDADAFALMEAFSADIGDGLHEQRQAAWRYAVRNPSAEGGVWDRFWGTAQFGAAEGPLTVPYILQVGDLFVYNDVTWRVLHEQEGAALIITEHVFRWNTPYNTPENIYTRLSYSYLRGALDAWAQDNLGTLRRHALTPIGVDDDVRSGPEAPGWSAAENAAAGLTGPGARTNSDAAVFVLSLSEANQYFGPPGENGRTPENDAARIAKNIGGTTRGWWLRSPGMSVTAPVAYVLPSGGLSFLASTGSIVVGFRPALWIQI